MILTKAVYYIFSIYAFGRQYVVIKGMLQLPRLKYHMKTIGIDQSVSNGDSFEHNALNNIKRYTKMLVSAKTNKLLLSS